MSSRNELSFFGTSEWCCRCGGNLVSRKVAALYMGSRFEVELPTCEKCGFILVPENLALGKMLEVERILEDK